MPSQVRTYEVLDEDACVLETVYTNDPSPLHHVETMASLAAAYGVPMTLLEIMQQAHAKRVRVRRGVSHLAVAC